MHQLENGGLWNVSILLAVYRSELKGPPLRLRASLHGLPLYTYGLASGDLRAKPVSPDRGLVKSRVKIYMVHVALTTESPQAIAHPAALFLALEDNPRHM